MLAVNVKMKMLLWYFFRILCRTRNQIAFLLGKPSLHTTKTTHGPRNIYWRNSRAARLEVGYNVGRELPVRAITIFSNQSNLSCNKSVAWILTSDWIILHKNHAIHGTYVTYCKRLPRAGKTGNVYRFCCKAVELLATQYFRNLQQPNLLQDRSNSWLVKRPRPLLSWFFSN